MRRFFGFMSTARVFRTRVPIEARLRSVAAPRVFPANDNDVRLVGGGLAREESRGAHYRTDYPERDDANWMKTTVARYDVHQDAPVLEYVPVATPMIEPRKRSYGKVEGEKPATKPVPAGTAP